jgi:metal transporter CNNM
MAIVSRFSVEKAASVKQVVKRGLTQRLKDRVGMGDSSSDEEADKHGRRATEDGESEGTEDNKGDGSHGDRENDQDADHKPQKRVTFRGRGRSKRRRAGRVAGDLEAGIPPTDETKDKQSKEKEEAEAKSRLTGFVTGHGLEQYMPADAVLAKEGAEEVCGFTVTLSLMRR